MKQEETTQRLTFTDHALQAYTQRNDQLNREGVTKHEQTFDAQRAKLRFALENSFGEYLPTSIGVEEIQFDTSPDEETGEYAPKVEIDGITFVARRFDNGALLAVETQCPQTGEIVQTPVSSMADVGKVLSEPPLSPLARNVSQNLLTPEQTLARAAAALYNAALGDSLAPIMYLQAVSTREMAYTMERVERSLAHIGGNLVDINQALSDHVYGTPDDSESGVLLFNPEIQDQWQLEVNVHKKGSLVANLYSVEDNLNRVHFYFLLDGRQLLYSNDERAPQWVFDGIKKYLNDKDIKGK